MHRISIVVVVCFVLVVFNLRLGRAMDELIECDPEPTDMTMGIGDIVNCEISPVADSDLFRFSGTAGDTIQLTLTDTLTPGRAPTPVAQVFDPDQELLDTLSQDGSGDVRQLTLSKTGMYTILVTDDGDNNSVAYHLALQSLFPPPPEAALLCYGCTLEATIDPIADSDIALFSGTAGDMIQLTLTDTLTPGRAPTPVAQVFDPNQELLDTLSQDGSGDVRQLTLSKTGMYTILITDDGDNNSVSYNLALQCLFGECTAPLIRPLVGGSVRGFMPTSAICRNDTTEQSVTIPLERTTSWDCEAAGLVVNDGDRVFTGAEGEAGGELPPPPLEVLGIFSETAEPRLMPDEDAFIGTFAGGGAIFGEFVEDTIDIQEGTVSLRSTVSVNASQGGFAGWFVSWGTEAQAGDNGFVRDMSVFTGDRLIFWVRTPINLEVGIRSGNVAAGSETSKALLSEVDGFTPDNTWQRLCISLSTFTGSAPKADLRRMKVFFVVASNTSTGGTGGQPQTFLIDDVRWETASCS